MAGTVSLELDPVFLKGLGYLHSKSKDSAEKLKALLDESMARGSDSTYRTSKDVEVKVPGPKATLTKHDSKSSSSSSSGSSSSKSSSSEKLKREREKRPAEKVRVTDFLDVPDPPKKARTEKAVESRSSPITVPASKELSLPDLSGPDETSADIFAMEMGLACVVCRQMTVTSGNQLVECQECHNLYHQECHKPQVTDKDVNDPRLVWYCARCTRQMKSMAQKSQKPPQKPSPTSTSSAAPVVKDSLVKKPEMKPKLETTNFQAFKRTEVKASATTASNNSASGSLQSSGLTGWAAFTKTSTAGPSTTKLGSSAPGPSGKSTPPSSTSKPTGLSGMASAKSGLAGTKSSSSPGGGNNGSAPLKSPPPLTLGKQAVLSRSSSGDGQGKVTVAGPSATASSPGASSASSTSGVGGGNGGGNNAGKSQETPTSQESQLQAMKRLQMVKKKAAQKKLKK